MKAMFLALLAGSLVCPRALAKGCATFLEQMRSAQYEMGVDHRGRNVASVESDPVEAKKERIKALKEFLAVEDLPKQKALATVMVNYLLDRAIGRPGNLAAGADLVSKRLKDLRVIQPNDPKSPIHQFLMNAKVGDVEDIKALTVYVLRVKSLGVDPAKAKTFLETQIQQGNHHFRVLDDNCVVGDPVFEKMAMN